MDSTTTKPPVRKPSGWKGHKGDRYYTKGGKYGQRYLCQTCGKEALGLGSASHNHWADCPHRATHAPPIPREDVRPSAAMDAPRPTQAEEAPRYAKCPACESTDGGHGLGCERGSDARLRLPPPAPSPLEVVRKALDTLMVLRADDGIVTGQAKKIRTALVEVEAALRPFANFAEKYDAKPMRGMDDRFYGIHAGSEHEAELKVSDCRRARDVLGR